MRTAVSVWNDYLRALRRGRNLSIADLSAGSGVSEASIRAYETGRRHPSRAHLARLLDWMHADAPTRSSVLADAGFAPDSAPEHRFETSVGHAEAIALLQRRLWPAFLVNHRAEVLAVKDPARRFLKLPPERAGAAPASILTFATRRAMAERCVNWDMAVTVMIRGFKAGNPAEESLDAPSPSFAPLVDAVCAGDPALVARFAELWRAMPAWRGPFAGVVYETIWKARGRQTIRFNCAINCMSSEAGLYFHDWIPADSASFRLLEEQLAGEATLAH